jgi:hypothetical protein
MLGAAEDKKIFLFPIDFYTNKGKLENGQKFLGSANRLGKYS